MYNKCTSPSSARSTLRGTTGPKMRFPICCLGANVVVEPEAMITGQRTPRSPYEWFKSTAQELELRDRCRRVKSRIKVTCRNHNCAYNCVHHQRHQTQTYPGNFTYDALTYALNFEDDLRSADEDGSFPNFTARLPQSPVTKSRSTTVDLISF